MPRPPRVEFPEALYHVTARGVLKSAIVRDDHDRVRWCDYMKEAVRRFGLELYAFALLDNHFHLFLSTPLANLWPAMQYLNGAYAAYFNARHERKGHLFEKRYRAILIESQGHYTEVSRYIHLNPVRAGLAERPEDYAWSSYPGYHSGRLPLPWLNYGRVLAEYTTEVLNKGVRPLYSTHARERYREFVARGVGKKLAPPWLHAVGGWLLGSPKFASKIYALLAKDARGDRWDSRARQGSRGIDVTLDEMAQAVCKEFGITLEQLKARDARVRAASSAFVFLARERGGFSLKSIGERIGVDNPGTVFMVGRRASARVAKMGEFRETAMKIESALVKVLNKGV